MKHSPKPNSSRLPKGLLPGAGLGYTAALLLEIIVTLILTCLNHWPGYGNIPTWEQAVQRTFAEYSVGGVLLPFVCCSGAGALAKMVSRTRPAAQPWQLGGGWLPPGIGCKIKAKESC